MVPPTGLECSLWSITGERRFPGSPAEEVSRSTSSGALDVNFNAIHGLFTLGLAAGFRPDPKIGSEAAFAGRIYRVWTFRHVSAGGF